MAGSTGTSRELTDEMTTIARGGAQAGTVTVHGSTAASNTMPPAANRPMPWLERVRDPSLTALLAGLLLLTFVVTPSSGWA